LMRMFAAPESNGIIAVNIRSKDHTRGRGRNAQSETNPDRQPVLFVKPQLRQPK